MKIGEKIFVFLLLLVLIFLPLQNVQAKGLLDGPIIAGNITLKDGDVLNQDLLVLGGSVTIAKGAQLKGNLVIVGGSLTIDGEVLKDVAAAGGAVELGPDTHIHGNLITLGVTVKREPGARIDGSVLDNGAGAFNAQSSNFPNDNFHGVDLLLQALSAFGQSLVWALLALVLAMFLPVQLRRVSDALIQTPLTAFGLGLVSVITYAITLLTLILFSFLIITLILTVPLIFVISVIFVAGWAFGWLGLGLEVGLRISEMFRQDWPLPLSASLGTFLLNLLALGLGFIPCVGGLVAPIVGLLGLGAVVMTRFGMKPFQNLHPAQLPAIPPPE